jgi:cell fate regulator YaaT (PSP1 superfamily)
MACASCSSGADGKPAGCRNNGYCKADGCDKLGVFDWLAGVPLPQGQQAFDGVEVRFKNTRKAFFRNTTGQRLVAGDLVTVDAAPGHDVGMVSLSGELVRAQMARRGLSGDTYELRRVLRKSTQEDIDRWHAARQREEQTRTEARTMARRAGLNLKVTDVEFQGDGAKVFVYYTAEERIDFRGLVRELSDHFRVRVEMRQVGARQESGRIGGIGSCGRELCCSTWLTDFRSVTTSAARYQQLSLNPQKLAGQCGKLKCCLNYELDMYIEAIKGYPSQNAKLKTQQGTGVHLKTDIFTGMMWYTFKRPGEPPAMAGFPVDTVRSILEQNRAGVLPAVDLNMAAQAEATEEKQPDYENVVGQDELTRFDDKLKAGRRKKKKKGRGGGAPSPAGQQQAAGMHPQERGDRNARRRRRSGRSGGPSKPAQG